MAAHPATVPTDGELVTLALKGGERAFARLIGRHDRHLHRVLARRMPDREDVLDCIQETHLAIWRALGTYDTRRPFQGWLTAIALNKYRDWARHRRACAELLERLEHEIAAQPAAAGPRGIERVLMASEALRGLVEALERLPAEIRNPLLLTAVGELPQARVARRLGITRKAVEMRVRRARLRLESALCGARGRAGLI